MDLGKLDGWFGLERGVYLGKNYDLLYYHNYLYYCYYNIIFTIGNNLYCLGKGGQLRSEREILWEDASPHDFSYWNNIREDRKRSLKIRFDNRSRGLRQHGYLTTELQQRGITKGKQKASTN